VALAEALQCPLVTGDARISWALGPALPGYGIAGLIAVPHQMLMQPQLTKVEKYLCVARNS
jgi:hypothetical protein